MWPDRRAVLFDLDDTLYPYRRFAASGFVAVAAHLERTGRVDRRRAFRTLLRASRGLERGRELQVCVNAFGLTPALVPALVNIIRQHHPVLSLPRAVARVLSALRSDGWRLGIVTNGPRAIQARKVASLGVARYVDTVIFASEHGSGQGKPDREPFAEALGRLHVAAAGAVFVGNDERCDVEGAAAAGLSAVRSVIWTPLNGATSAHAVIDRMQALPDVAARLIEHARNRHAA